MPIQWYEAADTADTADPRKPLTYTLSKGRHMLDMLHAIRVPNIVLTKEGKKKDSYTVSANDDKRIKDQLARQKSQVSPTAPQ